MPGEVISSAGVLLEGSVCLMLLNPGLGTGTKGLQGIAKLLPTPRFSFPKLSKKR